MPQNTIPVNAPLVPDEAKTYVLDCLGSGWISSAGKYLAQFEQEFAAYVNQKHAIAVCNGTVSLHLILAALGIGPGDEVIVPAQTIISCLDAVLYTGATPVIVDVEPDIYTLDPAHLEKALSPRTKAIMPVHIFGHSADMDPINAFAGAHGLFVVEDAAEAHGARYKKRICGSLGTAASFSFYANKLITTGEGGMVVTNDDALAARMRSMKDLCHLPGQRFHHAEVGFNYRMTNMQAALGCAQLLHAEEFLKRKQRMGRRYTEGLAGLRGIVTPVVRDWAVSSYWMYGIRVTPEAGMTRDEFRRRLLERGVDTRDFFWSLSEQPLLATHPSRTLPCPVSERLAREGCYLPSGLALTGEEIERVMDAVRAVIG
ncbi:DegT/DnrJ/EryC1/StrS family aminotransferase [bacterium]|nr:DegT/DnrJ/EryC1/StrS family aminotransferase [bacterium]